MRNQSQYKNLFSEGLTAGQPPTRAQLDAARQAVADECQTLSVKVQLANTYAAIVTVAQFLSLLLLVVSVVHQLRAGTFLEFGSPVIVLLLTIILLLVQTCIQAFYKRLATALESRQATLAWLLPMSPEQQPETCLAYAALGDEHEMIRAYQQQIAAQGRLPVMAEYTFAETWVKNQRAQQARDAEIRAAKAACQQWEKPV